MASAVPTDLPNTTPNSAPHAASTDVRPPRLWPACVILAWAAVAFVISVTPSINNAVRFGYMMLGPASALLLFGLWLLFFSRLPWRERLGYAGAGFVGLAATALLIHETMGVMLFAYGVPLTLVAVTAGLFRGRRLAPRPRAIGVLAAIGVVCAGFLPLRLAGIRGDYLPEFAWRWTRSAEERLTATGATEGTPATMVADGAGSHLWIADAIEWPRFRGAAGDSRASDLGAPLDFAGSPPRELWRISIGPGWSSFTLVSGRLFTQEQRGDDECTSCYDADSGRLVWRDATPCRFSDVVAGAGPRATPTFAGGRIYAFGAKAVLTCLDAASGRVIWRRDLLKEVDAVIPVWGCSCSPLVHGDRVLAYVGGKDDHGLVAFDAATGETIWKAPSSGMNFSSPQPARFGDRDVVLFNDPQGVTAYDPLDGSVVWRYKPRDWAGMVICQSQQIDDSSLLVPLGDGIGVARLKVERQGDEWTIAEEWASKQLKPSFNDFVYHDGHVYGFDQHILTCLDATTGRRRWKGGRYGFGQMLLVPAASQILVLAESGELVLVAADPEGHRELGRLAPLAGKTWNHPIAVGERIFVRNGEQAACLTTSAP